MHRRRLAALVSGSLIAGSVAVAVSTPAAGEGGPPNGTPPPAVSFAEIGRYDTGAAVPDDDVTAAEIVAVDGATMYVMTVGGIDIVDISDPTAPIPTGQIILPGDPTSVAVDDGLVATSVPGNPRTSPGTVFFFQGSTPVGQVTVGALPDMVTFTPDGRTLVVANEGEPSGYGAGSIDPEGSVSLIETKEFRKPRAVNRPPSEQARTISFTDFNADGSRHGELPAEVRISGPGATVAMDLEPEYVTIADDSRTAWVSLQENNAIAILDLKSQRVERIVALGTSDHNAAGFGIDASNSDRRINIANWDVEGLYMPDGIANYKVRGTNYVITANEGDAREYGSYTDVGRARSVADLVTIPAAADNTQLGRLNVITSTPAPKNAAGKITELYSFGSRSFTIRTADGGFVWDSGDAFEQMTAEVFPDNFNASNSNNEFDNRSDDKGPEPENVVVGEINRRHYAFVGLERIGGVMVYDVTDPNAPVFQQYLTTRVFPADPDGAVGPDSGPEGLAFVSAKDSPTGQPLLMVGNEFSGTVNIFELA